MNNYSNQLKIKMINKNHKSIKHKLKKNKKMI